MQSLDSLGSGFTLASHDLDIRGAGNLLGDEQSGHIKDVGVELYQPPWRNHYEGCLMLISQPHKFVFILSFCPEIYC